MSTRAPRWIRRAASLAAAVCAVACSDAVVMEDAARFDARDATITAPDGPAANDAAGDLAPLVDITLYDAARPSDATSFDAPVVARDVTDPCQSLAETYAVAVRGAQSCAGDAACGALVCETLCCACRVFVDPRSADYARIAALRAMWEASPCSATARCESVPCEEPTGAVCSTEGRCVTLRRTARDAGLAPAADAPDGGIR